MPGVQIYYCWVKLSKRKGAEVQAAAESSTAISSAVADSSQAAGAGAADSDSQALGVRDRDVASTFINGGLPPDFFRNGMPIGLLSGSIPPHVLNGGLPPGARLGGYFASGWWTIDEKFSGDPNGAYVVGFQPVEGTRDDAVDWLKNHPDWLDASVETYFLMIFASANHSS